MTLRRGSSLIEMVTIIVVGSLILGLSAGILHALMNVDRSGRAHVAGLARETRLAQLFRQDARSAQSATAPAVNTLTLDLGGDHRVEYRVEANEIHRVERTGDAVRNQDAFAVPRGGAARFKIEPAGPATLVRLLIEKAPATAETATRREARIEAVLGQDHRFEIVEQ